MQLLCTFRFNGLIFRILHRNTLIKTYCILRNNLFFPMFWSEEKYRFGLYYLYFTISMQLYTPSIVLRINDYTLFTYKPRSYQMLVVHPTHCMTAT